MKINYFPIVRSETILQDFTLAFASSLLLFLMQRYKEKMERQRELTYLTLFKYGGTDYTIDYFIKFTIEKWICL